MAFNPQDDGHVRSRAYGFDGGLADRAANRSPGCWIPPAPMPPMGELGCGCSLAKNLQLSADQPRPRCCLRRSGEPQPPKSAWPAEAQQLSRALKSAIDLTKLAGGLLVEQQSEDAFDAPRGRLRLPVAVARPALGRSLADARLGRRGRRDAGLGQCDGAGHRLAGLRSGPRPQERADRLAESVSAARANGGGKTWSGRIRRTRRKCSGRRMGKRCWSSSTSSARTKKCACGSTRPRTPCWPSSSSSSARLTGKMEAKDLVQIARRLAAAADRASR